MTATLTGSDAFSPPAAGPRRANSSTFESISPKRVTVRIYPERSMPIWLNYVLRRLNDLSRRLEAPTPEPAPLPDPTALERALDELRSVLSDDAPTPSVVPTVDAGVQFVWHSGGWDIEIEVLPLHTEVWARNQSRGERWTGPLDQVRSQLLRALDDVRRAAG